MTKLGSFEPIALNLSRYQVSGAIVEWRTMGSMEAFRAETTILKGGRIRLEHIPFSEGEKVEVVIRSRKRAGKSWPKDYFETTFGAIKDDGFKRHPQGEYEAREALP